MIKNLFKDEEKAPLGGDRPHPLDGIYRKAIRAIAIAPFTVAGLAGGFLISATWWGNGNITGSLLIAAAGAASGTVLGMLATRLLAKALRVIKRPVPKRGQKPEPVSLHAEVAEPAQVSTAAVAADEVSSQLPEGNTAAPTLLPRKRLYGYLTLICAGIGALAVLGLVGGLVPATIGSVLFAMTSLGGGALSFVLGKRRGGQGGKEAIPPS